jgi:hypothetical protein
MVEFSCNYQSPSGCRRNYNDSPNPCTFIGWDSTFSQMENPPALSADGQACLDETDPENCESIGHDGDGDMIAEDACYFDNDTDFISGSCAGLSSGDCSVEVLLVENNCEWYVLK